MRKYVIIASIASFIFIIVLAVIIVQTVDNANFKSLTSKQSFSENDLTNVTEKIFKNVTDQKCFCKIVDLDYYNERLKNVVATPWPRDYNNYKKIDGIINENNIFLLINNTGSLFIYPKPTEITAAFECFIRYADKSLPKELIAIEVSFSTGGFDNIGFNSAIILKSEFEELYANTDVEGLTTRQAAQKLADIWISKNGYEKK